MNRSSVVRVNRVEKGYHETFSSYTNMVLNKINMTVNQGSIYALLGASGCGKTTLLSCIVGIQKCQSGNISVLGHKVDTNLTNKIGHKIGFMPQETALINELTVKETVFFFGNIYQMKIDKLQQRYQMMRELFELPPDDRRVESCSGGQQRRISFCVTIIHEPDLLILDEPTVGLDPLLREKIWDFLVHETRNSKLAIIITTHYIDEANHADQCGLMRNGILLDEDTPKNIIAKNKCSTLEDAFLKLCMRQEEGAQSNLNFNTYDVENQAFEAPADLTVSNAAENYRKNFSIQSFSALVKRNYLQLQRQPAGVLFIMFLPLLTILLFFNAIGSNPLDLKLAIVNKESESIANCRNFSVANIEDESRCELNLVSCKFLLDLSDDAIKQIPYDDFNEAYRDTKLGKVTAVIEFSKNYSASLGARFFESSDDYDNEVYEESQIKVTMDQTNHLITNFLKKRLHDVFRKFAMSLTEACGLSPKLAVSPVTFKEPIYGDMDADFKSSMAPPLIIVNLFFMASCLIAFIFLEDRKSGSWNRVLFSGLQMKEIIASHVIIQAFVLLIQLIQTLAIVLFYYDYLRWQQILILITIFIAAQYSGLFVGMCVSCMTDTVMKTQFALTGLVLLMLLITGVFWPTEGMVDALKVISNYTPFTLPAKSFRDVLLKNYDFNNPSVTIGIIIPLVWVAFSIAGVSIILRYRKFN